MSRIVNFNLEQGASFSTSILAYSSDPYSLNNGSVTENTDFLPLNLGDITSEVSSLTITNPGSGYLDPPTISFINSDGTGATAYCTVENGIVNYTELISGGEGYTILPQVSISSPPNGGVQATAVCTMNNNSLINGILIDLSRTITMKSYMRKASTSTIYYPFTILYDINTSEITLSMLPILTKTIPDGDYIYDVVATFTDGSIKRIIEGKVTVLPGVTY